MYKTADETKPDLSLSGVWIEKDVDTNYASKVSQMNQEESIYGFIANTKAIQINSNDVNAIQKYVGADASVRPQIDNPTNLNRIILKIINNNQYEPIKANITHNTIDKKIEIKVTYTKNGISQIIDEYGNAMTLTEENGIILADTGTNALGIGTYKYTIIDTAGNKKELSITPTINSLFKVAYINGTDNMDNTATYNKTQETISSAETTLLNQIKATDTTKTFDRAIQDTNGLTTAVSQTDRLSEEEQMYLWNIYTVNTRTTYTWKSERAESSKYSLSSTLYFYTTLTQSSTGNSCTLSNVKKVIGHDLSGSFYTLSSSIPRSGTSNSVTVTDEYYAWSGGAADFERNYYRTGYRYYRTEHTEILQRTFYNRIINKANAYTDKALNGSYWYEKGEAIPKYILYKYSSDLNLLSTYDVDTKVLTTVPIDVSNKGRNKLMLTLKATGYDYKTYISNDNTNWQEVTEITSDTPKELNVGEWNNLYIKIETNTSTINNIDIAYYKD